MNHDHAHMKQNIKDIVDQLDPQLRELSRRIHANPELSFGEVQAQQWLTEPLEAAGFQVEKGISGLPTSFRAVWEGQADGPTIALLAEYDALPRIGHACGHNLIGTSAVGAAMALKKAFPELPGRIIVLGTPAEEEGGGKIIMANDGVFDGIDAVMMCHPQQNDGTSGSTGLWTQPLRFMANRRMQHLLPKRESVRWMHW